MSSSPFQEALGLLRRAGLQVEADGRYVLVEDSELGFTRSHDGLSGIRAFVRETLEEYENALVEKQKELIKEFQQHQDEQAQAELEEAAAARNEWTEEEQRAQADLELLEIMLEEEAAANAAQGPPEEFGEGGRPPDYTGADELPEEEAMKVKELIELWTAFLGRSEDPYLIPEPAKGGGLSPKEVYEGSQIDDQDKGGIPRPEQYEEEYITEMKQEAAAVAVLVTGQRFVAPEGYVIKEYRPTNPGSPVADTYLYGSILRARKARYEGLGSRFTLAPNA